MLFQRIQHHHVWRAGEDRFPETETEWCAYWHYLDKKFGTTKASPLHHDNRCENHGLQR